MIRLLLLALLFFLGYTLLKALLGAPRRRQPPQNRSPQGETMVQDPQCGTYLPQGEAVQATISGRKHFFCSDKCRDAYRRARKKQP